MKWFKVKTHNLIFPLSCSHYRSQLKLFFFSQEKRPLRSDHTSAWSKRYETIFLEFLIDDRFYELLISLLIRLIPFECALVQYFTQKFQCKIYEAGDNEEKTITKIN